MFAYHMFVEFLILSISIVHRGIFPWKERKRKDGSIT